MLTNYNIYAHTLTLWLFFMNCTAASFLGVSEAKTCSNTKSFPSAFAKRLIDAREKAGAISPLQSPPHFSGGISLSIILLLTKVHAHAAGSFSGGLVDPNQLCQCYVCAWCVCMGCVFLIQGGILSTENLEWLSVCLLVWPNGWWGGGTPEVGPIPVGVGRGMGGWVRSRAS